MDEHAEFEKYYSEFLAGEELPEAVTAGYRILGCLRRGEGKELYLAADRQTYRYCVVKLAYGRQREFLRREAESLREVWTAIEGEEGTAEAEKPAVDVNPETPGRYRAARGPETPGIIHIYGYIEGDGYAALVREYCEGVTLKQMTDQRGRLTEAETIGYGVQICGILDRLHRMTPPMIHRDVKPENLLVTADGRLVMLDFDTARRFRPEKERDTVFTGSKDTAAPEQFGFRQTDVRTDIYGAGRTLLYLLCGSFEERRLADADCSGNLKKVIRKAAAFEPDSRYQEAELLGEALRRCVRAEKAFSPRRGKRRRGQAFAALAGAAAGAVLTALACAAVWKGIAVPDICSENMESQSGAETRSDADSRAETEILLFNPEIYREELDRAMDAYRSQDYETLGEASSRLAEQIYGDPALNAKAAEDREFFESGEFSEDMIRQGEVSLIEKLNYRLWYDDEMLLRKQDWYRTNGRRIADAMDEMLNTVIEEGDGIVNLYDYLFSENADDLRTADILWDFLSVLTTAASYSD